MYYFLKENDSDSENERAAPFITKYMSFKQMQRNLNNKMYKTTQAFFSDAKYITHNTCIDSCKLHDLLIL